MEALRLAVKRKALIFVYSRAGLANQLIGFLQANAAVAVAVGRRQPSRMSMK